MARVVVASPATRYASVDSANSEESDDSLSTDEEAILDEQSERSAPLRLLFLLCLCASIEGGDMVLLGSTAFALQRDIHLSMNGLAAMNLVQALGMAAMAPLWGVLADRAILPRKSILIIGAVAQGVITIVLAMVNSVWPMIFLRGLNGVMLASLRPVARGIVADVASERQRGKAFGWIELSVNLGMCGCGLVAAPMSTTRITGVQGWRVAYVMVGCGAMGVGLLLAALMEEPEREAVASSERVGKRRAMAQELNRFLSYFSKPTFCVLVIQGMFGCVPWNALSFQTVFFQLSGLTSFQSGALPAMQQCAGALGSLLGGCIGDSLAIRCPFHGRAFAAQISVAAGIPVAVMIFLHVPPHEVAFMYYAALVIFLGLTATWTPAATNLPMLSAIVDPDGRAIIMAWQSALEGSWGAIFGNAAVGILAQNVFGYDISLIGDTTEMDPANMRALGRALTFTSLVPWLVCFVAYSALHWSYRRDLKMMYKQKQVELAGEEMRQLSGPGAE